MRIFKIVVVVLIALTALASATLFLTTHFKEKPGGVFINTDPVANIYINGSFVGKTPYTNSFKASEITLKLVPENPDQNLIPYETKITLVAGIQTVVRREFGNSEEISSGDIISFNKIISRDAGLIVISTPANAQVSVDGLPQGFAPYSTSSILPAKHQITVKAPGYTDRIMTVQTQGGYRLSLFAKLAKVVEPEPTPTPEIETYIQILTTPTGYLRVRTAPGVAGEEIAEVKPGTQYQFLSEDVATGWVEIQYEATAPGLPNGITGWVSGQYTKKVIKDGESSASAVLK